MGLGSLGPVYRLRPSACDKASYYNNTEAWHYENDWVMFPRYGMCPLGAVELSTSGGVSQNIYKNCHKWNDKDTWRKLDANNFKSNYTWDPLSENYKPNPEYTSSIVSPYTSHVNETFESTFESGAENWSYMYGLLVAACVLVIVAALITAQLGYQRRAEGSLRPTNYNTEIAAMVFLLACVVLFYVAYSLSANTLQLNKSAWEKSYFATCKVQIWPENGFTSSFASLVLCSFYLVLCSVVTFEASYMGRDGAPFKCSNRIEQNRMNLRRRRLEARLGIGSHGEHGGLIPINNRRYAQNPQLVEGLHTAQCELVVVYDVNGVASTQDKASSHPPRVLSRIATDVNTSPTPNRRTRTNGDDTRFQVISTSDIEVALQEVNNSSIPPVNGQFIDLYDDDVEEGIVTTVDGSVCINGGSDRDDTPESSGWGFLGLWEAWQSRPEERDSEFQRSIDGISGNENSGFGGSNNGVGNNNGSNGGHVSNSIVVPEAIARHIPAVRYG